MQKQKLHSTNPYIACKGDASKRGTEPGRCPTQAARHISSRWLKLRGVGLGLGFRVLGFRATHEIDDQPQTLTYKPLKLAAYLTSNPMQNSYNLNLRTVPVGNLVLDPRLRV